MKNKEKNILYESENLFVYENKRKIMKTIIINIKINVFFSSEAILGADNLPYEFSTDFVI